MEARQDLTAARLLALNPDLLTAGAARSDGRNAAETPRQPASPAKVSLSGLPTKGAIHWGPASGPKLIVFSDFQCSYCRKLSDELKSLGARVEERPISIFGAASRKLSEQVYCSANPAAALHAAYGGLALARAKPCDTSGLDANEAFARKHGFGGTPVIRAPIGRRGHRRVPQRVRPQSISEREPQKQRSLSHEHQTSLSRTSIDARQPFGLRDAWNQCCR